MARLLALGGAKVYCAARSEDKSRRIIDAMLSSNPNIKRENLVMVPLDLLSLESVQEAVNIIKRSESKLDLLSRSPLPKAAKQFMACMLIIRKTSVNNAGVLTTSFQKTRAGWDSQMATKCVQDCCRATKCVLTDECSSAAILDTFSSQTD